MDCLGFETDWLCTNDKEGLLDATDGAVAAAGSCHLSGPKKMGYGTCVCQTKPCTAGLVAPQNATRRQWLGIGDSVMRGMSDALEALLVAQGWEYELAPDSGKTSTNYASRCVDTWLSTRPLDVISFMVGSHDLAHDSEQLTLEAFKDRFKKLLQRLAAEQVAHDTKLVWLTITPVPTTTVCALGSTFEIGSCLNPPRYEEDIRAFNEAADELMMESHATFWKVNLHEFVTSHCGGPGFSSCSLQEPNNMHFTEDGYRLLATEVVQEVLNALNETQPSS